MLKKSQITAVMVFVFALTAGAASTEKVKKETGEAVDAAGAYVSENREAFTNQMKANIATLEDDIAELKGKASAVGTSASESTSKKIAELEKRRDSLKKDLSKLTESSGRAWTQMRDGMSRAWGEVKTAYNKAASEFDKKDAQKKETATKKTTEKPEEMTEEMTEEITDK